LSDCGLSESVVLENLGEILVCDRERLGANARRMSGSSPKLVANERPRYLVIMHALFGG
jgi:hypothetical protein